MNDAVNIAEAVKDVLNAATLSQTFTAQRTYTPVYDVKEEPGIKVFVVPTGSAIANATRSEDERTHTIMVGIYNTIGVDEYNATSGAEVDAMLSLAAEIVDLFLTTGNRVENPDAALTDITNDPSFDPASLDQHNVFVTVVELKYKLIR